MLRRAILMLTLAAIAVLVVAPAAESKSVTCKSGQVCKGTNADDVIIGSTGNDNIRPMGGNDYVFANGGADEVAVSDATRHPMRRPKPRGPGAPIRASLGAHGGSAVHPVADRQALSRSQ